MALADELLDAAQHLADVVRTDGGRRRAISTGYYAVFHAFISAGVDLLLSHEATRVRASRAFSHSEMRTVCDALSKLTAASKTLGSFGLTQPPSPALAEAAAGFVQLHGLREKADYQVSTPVAESEMRSALSAARSTVTTVQQLQAAADHDLICCLSATLFRS